jgi:hypothetical protein
MVRPSPRESRFLPRHATPIGFSVLPCGEARIATVPELSEQIQSLVRGKSRGKQQLKSDIFADPLIPYSIYDDNPILLSPLNALRFFTAFFSSEDISRRAPSHGSLIKSAGKAACSTIFIAPPLFQTDP